MLDIEKIDYLLDLHFVRLGGESGKIAQDKNWNSRPKKYSDVRLFDSYGVKIEPPYIVLDFDKEPYISKALEIVKTYGLTCPVMKTTKGIHLWFKTSKDYKNSVRVHTACGLECDVRSHSKASYVAVKVNGVNREWLNSDFSNVPTLPPYFRILTGTEKNKALCTLKSGDGRNSLLYSYILYLQKHQFTHNEIKETYDVINSSVLEEPLAEDELETILREEAFNDDVYDIGSLVDKKGRYIANEVAKWVVKNHTFIIYNNRMYEYKDGWYERLPETGKKRINHLLDSELPNINRHEKNEVFDKVCSAVCDFSGDYNRRYNDEKTSLCVENGILNVLTGELSEHTPDRVFFGKANVVYTEDACYPLFDETLRKVFANDEECIDLYWEMVGSCLVDDARFGKSFFLYGDGGNGKSTIAKCIVKLLTYEYCSTLSLQEFEERFKVAELHNKRCNFGDDIGNTRIKNTGYFKKLVTGEPITAERKGQDPFTFECGATNIFTLNEFPSINDKTNGWMRRIIILPCNATAKDFGKKDIGIFDKLTSAEGLQYMLKKAVEGLQRLVANNGEYTNPQCVREMTESYEVESSSVLSWVNEKGLSREDFINVDRAKLYTEYKAWCMDDNFKYTLGKVNFYKYMKTHYDLDCVRCYHGENADKYVFVENITI